MKRISGWLMAGAAAIAFAACGEKAPEPAPEVSPETAQIPTIAPGKIRTVRENLFRQPHPHPAARARANPTATM